MAVDRLARNAFKWSRFDLALGLTCGVLDYRKLDVYWETRRLARRVFAETIKLPLYLRWRLGGQLDDAVESIGANLAEGAGRKNGCHGNAELIRYAHIAYGSACETEHRIHGLHDRNLITNETHADLAAHVDRIKGMLWRLIQAWKRDDRGKSS